MELPPWFQNAIQSRLEDVTAMIRRQSEQCKLNDEENKAFEAMFSGVDKTLLPGFMEWEDKHHFNRALENERLYLQGMRNGAQLVFALLNGTLPGEKT
ncbi:hypothetical protein [Cohnella zeiphila]|uniref:Uncharacterized protein n=1 Tax=Cohnella zeiphila TaxID=2761120 RepID=A0A7X0SSG4_9BACL|nr:hypothetical protein [Cohnella zeiphila]MBB6734055.1 hypothetical protein [Cohnella zeiphila]